MFYGTRVWGGMAFGYLEVDVLQSKPILCSMRPSLASSLSYHCFSEMDRCGSCFLSVVLGRLRRLAFAVGHLLCR